MRPRGPAVTFEAILFDCDGVLIDSEPITNGLLRDRLEASGWTISPAVFEMDPALLQAGATQLFGCMADLPELPAVA